jgi:arylsulfatase A-like enzyme
MLNFMDAHGPYDPPEPFRTMFDGGREQVDRYDGGIAYMDSVFGALVRSLAERGELDRTLLIVTSDHGEHWGEHGLYNHGNSLFLPLLHVPLVMRLPGVVPAGARIATPVSLRDLAATIAAVAGVPEEGGLPGSSLATTWTGGGAPSVVVAETSPGVRLTRPNLTSRGVMRSTLDSAWHYIRYGDGEEQLFAWPRDPAERTNLADSTSAREALAAQRERLARALERP